MRGHAVRAWWVIRQRQRRRLGGCPGGAWPCWQLLDAGPRPESWLTPNLPLESQQIVPCLFPPLRNGAVCLAGCQGGPVGGGLQCPGLVPLEGVAVLALCPSTSTSLFPMGGTPEPGDQWSHTRGHPGLILRPGNTCRLQWESVIFQGLNPLKP